jgi:hypothetical protein
MKNNYTIFGFGRDGFGRMGISTPYIIAINEKQNILWGYPSDGEINILFNNFKDKEICQKVINNIKFKTKNTSISDYPIQRMLQYPECITMFNIVFEHNNYKIGNSVDASMGNLGIIIGKYNI